MCGPSVCVFTHLGSRVVSLLKEKLNSSVNLLELEKNNNRTYKKITVSYSFHEMRKTDTELCFRKKRKTHHNTWYILIDLTDSPRDAGPADTRPKQTTIKVRAGNIFLACQTEMRTFPNNSEYL